MARDPDRRSFLMPWRLAAAGKAARQAEPPEPRPAAAPKPTAAPMPSTAATPVPPSTWPRALRERLLPLPPLPPLEPNEAPPLLTQPGAASAGTAVIDAARCTAYRGLPCRICLEVCPVAGVLTLTKSARSYVPVAGPEPCTGCGVCLLQCPARGAIRIVPRADGAPGHVQVRPASS